MDKTLAIQQIKETFENSFDKERFINFIGELLNRIDGSKAFHARGYVKEKYKKSAGIIKTYERIGTYTDSDNNKIDVLIVYLAKDNSIERARTTLRNFVADYLKGRGEKDAALVAFVSLNQKDWRFSLVKMDYQLEKDKVKQEFTPARRFSFLVGENENSHTAQSQLVPILEDDINNPTLERLEEAFNIETVTKEFFKKYHDLFLRLKDSIDDIVKNDKKIKQDFKKKKIDTTDFAKKTLGQIVFLYFLQKKGWFGVRRNEKWGFGSKHFLRELFNKKHGNYKNFFNNALEPLFYEALRLERPKDYYDKFECRIPFLNGGLFDPLNDYNWQDTDILISDEIFSNNNQTKEGDKGDGILDILDRYNFTVKEDEPFEKEVAIDPEMLGKVFENLLEVKDRKSKGTYYTPREIVHYMCQQSLINYLYTELNPIKKTIFKKEAEQGKLLGKLDSKQLKLSSKNKEIISKEDIEKLIKYGETVIEHDNQVIKKGKESGRYSFKLPKSIRDNAESIDKKLTFIRVCDPAIGSGAFPVGMMNEIIRARNVLTNHIKNKKNRTIYNFKRHAIQNCIYGVDIDLGAVEIAKLRLWLSLIVDEEDIKQIKPLPNLDYKIVCGNSLLGYPYTPQGLDKIEQLKSKLFDITDPNKKQELRDKIDGEINKLLSNTKKSLGYKVDFDFKIHFSEVFREKDGFDVVIANPPYVRQEEITNYKKDLQKIYQVYSARSDLYTYFYEKGTKLLTVNGFLIFISSNKFMRAKYGERLRRYIKNNYQLLEIIDFGSVHKFDAITNTLVLFMKNNHKKKNVFRYSEDIGLSRIECKQDELENDAWTLADDSILYLKKKIEKEGISLLYWKIKISYGIKAGYNDAFIIGKEMKDIFIKQNSSSEKVIKPLLRGRDIGKYHKKFADKYIIISKYQGHVEFEKNYPELTSHLRKFGKQLKRRGQVKNDQHHWMELDNNPGEDYLNLFSQNKIIWIELSNKNKFTYTEDGEYILAGAFMITGRSIKYLLAFLNSNLCLFYFRLICNSSGMATIQWKKFVLEKVPVPKLSKIKQKPFIDLVDKILAITKDDDYLGDSIKRTKVHKYEQQIDQLIYKLYGLNKKEIEIIENHK